MPEFPSEICLSQPSPTHTHNYTAHSFKYSHIDMSNIESHTLPLSTDPSQLPAPVDINLDEYSPTSVLISINPPADYETCITSYFVTVNDSNCSTLHRVENSKHILTCSDLDLYAAIYKFTVSACGLWLASSDVSTKQYKASGKSKLKHENICMWLI